MKFDRVMAKNQCTFSVVRNGLFLAAVENTQINLDDDTVAYGGQGYNNNTKDKERNTKR